MDDTMDFYTDEALGGDFDAPESSPTDPVESVEAAPSQPEQVQDEQPQTQAEPGAFNPEGPGDVKVALRQAREEARQYREQLAQYQAAMQAQQQAQPEIDPLDPDAFAYLQQQQDVLRQQMEQQTVSMRLEMSETLMRQQFPDYDETIARLAELGPVVNVAAFLQQPNPGLAAYEFAKRFTPQGIQKTIESEVQKRVSELTQKLQPQTPKAPKTIGNLPAAAPNTDAAADLSGISQRKLGSMSPQERDDWYSRALGG